MIEKFQLHLNDVAVECGIALLCQFFDRKNYNIFVFVWMCVWMYFPAQMFDFVEHFYFFDFFFPSIDIYMQIDNLTCMLHDIIKKYMQYWSTDNCKQTTVFENILCGNRAIFVQRQANTIGIGWLDFHA